MLHLHFNPRSPHGERPHSFFSSASRRLFQSTLPARGATLHKMLRAVCRLFQSTLPARGATTVALDILNRMNDFNPRSPHGERLCVWRSHPLPREFQSTLPARGATFDTIQECIRNVQFQSTLPARGATIDGTDYVSVMSISIHAPRTGSDSHPLPRENRAIAISIHAPRTGSDRYALRAFDTCANFNPRSPHGERR